MDPNETLREIRRFARAIVADIFRGSDADYHEQAESLANAIDELDTWISRGGFLPDAWNGNRLAAQPKEMKMHSTSRPGVPDHHESQCGAWCGKERPS